ncbi:MAG: hypothetical protein HY784_12000 [Chloroflexi bacterium]|nr:hypothetical protein [Chloroflexota bacterium]
MHTSQAADEVMGEALGPFLVDMARYNDLGMAEESVFACLGILSGLYRFDNESVSKFKDWATDLPGEYAILTLEEWKRGHPPETTARKLRQAITDNLPRWADDRLPGSKAGPAGG